MSQLEDSLNQWLLANTAIKAVVGVRVYWGFAPPPASVAPYLVVRRAKTNRSYTMGGPANPVGVVFRVTFWAENYKAACDGATLLVQQFHAAESDDIVGVSHARIPNEADSIEMTPEQLEKRYYGRFVDVELFHQE